MAAVSNRDLQRQQFCDKMNEHRNGRHIITHATKANWDRDPFMGRLQSAVDQRQLTPTNLTDIMKVFDQIFQAKPVKAEPARVAPPSAQYEPVTENPYPKGSSEESHFEFLLNCCAYPCLSIEHKIGPADINRYLRFHPNKTIVVAEIKAWLAQNK